MLTIFSPLTTEIISQIYRPHWNVIHPPHLGTVKILPIFDLIIIVWIFIAMISIHDSVKLRRVIKSILVVFLMISVCVQSLSQYAYYEQLKSQFKDKNAHDIRLSVFRGSYYFSQFILYYIRGSQYTGRLVTDLDTSGTLEPYILKYYLYPTIDLISEVNDPFFVVMFNVTDPVSRIPAGYREFLEFGPRCLVAVKIKEIK